MEPDAKELVRALRQDVRLEAALPDPLTPRLRCASGAGAARGERKEFPAAIARSGDWQSPTKTKRKAARNRSSPLRPRNRSREEAEKRLAQ